MDEVLKEFMVESSDNLDQLDRDFVTLEQDPNNKELISGIFRVIHTIKGTCGFLGFNKLEKVAHAGENLLSLMRAGDLQLHAGITNGLLAMVDAVRAMLTAIENTESDGDNEYPELIAQLEALQHGGGAASPEAVVADAQPAATVDAPVEMDAAAPEAQDAAPEDVPVIMAEAPEEPAAPLAVEAAPIAAPTPVVAATAVAVAAKPAAATEAKAAPANAAASDASLRVDVGLLDKLMNLVGELVLARNQILQFNKVHEDSNFITTSQRLNQITTELQENVMKTRMQPIGNIWSKFPRIIRDLAATCGKKISLQMEGQETELDKTLIEAIKDPLTHLLRNSADHGVETPKERLEKGKPEEGCIFLKAYHEGGQVNIEITDNGRGIGIERVKAKAIERGLITADEANRMNERQLSNLIFLPGFSTAEKVSNISGRGVGMDVVKTNIEKIGGVVDLVNRPGFGTTVKVKIPLTLAIVPALIITMGGELYAIPQNSLLELVRLEEDDAHKIELIQGTPVYRLRGKLLPLVYLRKELNLAELDETASKATNIVVLQADDRQFGLVVDSINDTQEIVVKPLSQQLKGIEALAGATIMGDGRVALILDILGVAQHANVVSELKDHMMHDIAARDENYRAGMQHLLIFTSNDDGRMAIPLAQVHRLEQFPRSAVEHVGGQDVVQYRDGIMPLVHISALIQERRSEPRHSERMATTASASDLLQVVVYSNSQGRVGLVIGQVLDIAEVALEFGDGAHRKGVLGSMVIHNRVTEILNIEAVVDMYRQNAELQIDLPTDALSAGAATVVPTQWN